MVVPCSEPPFILQKNEGMRRVSSKSNSLGSSLWAGSYVTVLRWAREQLNPLYEKDNSPCWKRDIWVHRQFLSLRKYQTSFSSHCYQSWTCYNHRQRGMTTGQGTIFKVTFACKKGHVDKEAVSAPGLNTNKNVSKHRRELEREKWPSL